MNSDWPGMASLMFCPWYFVMPLKPTAPPINLVSDDPVRLLLSDEVAFLLGVSERHLRNLTVPNGTLACVRLGGCVRYRREDIADFIESRTIRLSNSPK